MFKITRALAISALVVAATVHGATVHAQHTAGLNSTQTIQISAATRVLDLGSGDESQAPPNWTAANFDDSAWSPASPVGSDVITCVMQGHSGLSYLKSAPDYWGSNEGDSYLFRRTFTLPQAKSYYGSILAINGDTNNDRNVYVDGQNLPDIYDHPRGAIGQYLHSGVNVVAIYASATPDTTSANKQCSMISFTINVVMTDIQSAGPSAPAQLSTILPGQNAVLSGSSWLPFSWHAFPGASYYYLQIWLAVPAPGQAITSRLTTLFSARLTGTRYALNVRHMARGTYSWRMAAVGGNGKMLTGWTPEQSVQLQ